MRPVRLAIVGTGIAARDLHWPALQKLKKNFEIVAVCNRTRAKAEAFAELIGCGNVTTDYAEVLRDKNLEAVDLVLPIPLNFSFTRDALKAGKHVIVEKPIAASSRDAATMCKLAAASPRVAMVAENFRYRATFHRLKKILDRGTIGNVYTAQYTVFLSVTPATNKYARTKWRIKQEFPGGFPMDGGVHNVNAIRYLFGDAKTARATAKQVNPAIGELDTLSIQFETEKKISVDLKLFFSAAGFREIRLLIFGTKGTIELKGNSITLHRIGKVPVVEEVEDDGGYAGQFAAFFDAIRKGKETLTPFEEGRRDFETMLAALKAAETGKTVSLK